MSRRPTGPTGRDALSQITERLGALMGEVRTAFEQADAGKSGSVENTREFSLDTPAGPLKGVASFRVGSLADRAGAGAARSGAEHEVKRSARARPAAEMDDAREPLVDVFDETAEVLVVAELPGVKAEEFTVTVEDGSLVIATTGQRRFRAVRVLPAPVDAAAITTAMRNGILEIRLPKTGVSA